MPAVVPEILSKDRPEQESSDKSAWKTALSIVISLRPVREQIINVLTFTLSGKKHLLRSITTHVRLFTLPREP